MSTALVPQQIEGEITIVDYERPFDIIFAKQRYNAIVEFAKSVMQKDKDFGEIPGTDKPALLKPGAEKLTSFFGLSVEHPEITEKVEDWTGEKHSGQPFFYYQIRQDLTRNGKLIASQLGSCNSWETKYRYRWIKEADVPKGMDKVTLQTRDGSITEFAFAIDKAETTGIYGKPAEYWARFREAIQNGTARKGERKTARGMSPTWSIGAPLYRVPNMEPFDLVNTILKMAEKRALVAASLVGCNASEFFTQDVEDLDIIDVPFGEKFPSAKQPPSATPHTVTGGATLDDLTGGKRPPQPIPPPAKDAKQPSMSFQWSPKSKGQLLAKVADASKADDIETARKNLDAMAAWFANVPKVPPEDRAAIEQAIRSAHDALDIGSGEFTGLEREPQQLAALETLLKMASAPAAVDNILQQWEQFPDVDEATRAAGRQKIAARRAEVGGSNQ